MRIVFPKTPKIAKRALRSASARQVCKSPVPNEPDGTNQRRSSVGYCYYTLDNITSAKARRLDFGNFMIGQVPPQRILQHLPIVERKAESLEKPRFVPAVRVRLGQQVIRDLRGGNHSRLKIGDLHRAVASSTMRISSSVRPYNS